MRQVAKPQVRKKSSSSLPYIIVAVFVFGLSLAGAFFLWQFTVKNLNYFTAERLSIFVLLTGIIGSIFLFRLLYLFAISRDVERRRKIAVQNQLNATALASIGDGVIATDMSGRIVFMNKAMRDMAMIKGDVEGRELRSVFAIQDEKGKLVPTNQGPVARALKSGTLVATTITNPEYYFIRSDKTRFPGMVTATPIISNSDVAGAVLIVRDVTREKEIDQAKSEFVSLASHQLRTPLSTMRWYVETLMKGRAGKINKEQIQYLSTVYDAGSLMADLVNALLNVSRIELGTFAIDPEPTDLKKVAESVLAELKPEIKRKKLSIAEKYSLAKKINVDPNLMRIVFQNIIGNAVKYTPSEGKITIAIEEKKPNALITVSDTGYGIPAGDQDKIFGKLFRASNAKEKETDGNGLGLYIVKSILDHSGGKVWFSSPSFAKATEGKPASQVENAGTAFYVTIPLAGMKSKEGDRKLN
jgi:PAS domain S-box-containing protein